MPARLAAVFATGCLALLATPALAFECNGSIGQVFRAPGGPASKFTLASHGCTAPEGGRSSEQVQQTPAPAVSAAEVSTAPRLTEQLALYDRDLAFAAVEGSRPLYAAAQAQVLAQPRRPAPTGRTYAELVSQVAAEYDIDADFLHAIMFVESRANPKAISHAGARGLMQVMPATAKRFGVRQPLTELHDPYTNIRVAAVYLKKLQSLFGNDLDLVLAGYNAGEGAVMKYGRKVPPYRETRGYVKSVMARYKQLAGLQ